MQPATALPAAFLGPAPAYKVQPNPSLRSMEPGAAAPKPLVVVAKHWRFVPGSHAQGDWFWNTIGEVATVEEARALIREHRRRTAGRPVYAFHDEHGPLVEDLDLAEFLADNPDLDLEDVLAIGLLEPGEDVPLGGGAAPLTFLRRVA